MPEVGRYKLPVINVDEAVSRLRRIRETAGGRSASKEVAAEAMGMSPTGGATWHVLTGIAMYGLADFNNKELLVTDLGEAAIFGDSNEVLASKVEAVRRVELFKELFGKYGSNPSDEQIRAFLRQYAQVDLAKIPKLVERVSKLAKSMNHYAALVIKQGDSRASAAPLGRESTSTDTVNMSGDPNLMEVRIGPHYFRLPLDDLDLAGTLAKSNIDGIIGSLKVRRKVEASEKKTATGTG